MTGATAFYAFTGCLPQHLSTHANDLILWEAIHKATEDGYRFLDFGEVPEEHPELVRFKTKWGSLPKPLYRYYYPHPKQNISHSKLHWMRRVLSQTWQHMPLPITARFGEWIYKYL
jgi:lipid II:glycine glycyltransferase (peptidoglycan interpeptide bridge formation enzyme)